MNNFTYTTIESIVCKTENVPLQAKVVITMFPQMHMVITNHKQFHINNGIKIWNETLQIHDEEKKGVGKKIYCKECDNEIVNISYILIVTTLFIIKIATLPR